MYNGKEITMRQEARADIIEALRTVMPVYYCDLHNEVFNTGYYIVRNLSSQRSIKRI